MRYKKSLVIFVCIAAVLYSCSRTAPLAIFKKLSPHDAYGQKLKDAGLDHTAMGSAWLQAANESVAKALTVTLPYKETGYFASDKVPSSVLRFEVKRGQKLHIALSKRPELNFSIYIDLLQDQSNAQAKPVANADTSSMRLDYEIPKTGTYVLRLQPELLRGGGYTVTITTGPSLAFPVSASANPHIGSFWGDSRDEGGRRHEGIDIFAPKGTPALAAADGIITRVTENKLGGKVVFLRPDGRDYNLYYAHLGVQLVHDGQTVLAGDTVGLIDNTGNAKTTPSHLHLGIYTYNDGAVDPLPFVNREIKAPLPISAPENLLNATARTDSKTNTLHTSPHERSAITATLPSNTILTVIAATENWYKVSLPDGKEGFIRSRDVALATPIHKITLKLTQNLYDAPDTVAARKLALNHGSRVSLLGNYNGFYLVADYKYDTGWIEAR